MVASCFIQRLHLSQVPTVSGKKETVAKWPAQNPNNQRSRVLTTTTSNDDGCGFMFYIGAAWTLSDSGHQGGGGCDGGGHHGGCGGGGCGGGGGGR